MKKEIEEGGAEPQEKRESDPPRARTYLDLPRPRTEAEQEEVLTHLLEENLGSGDCEVANQLTRLTGIAVDNTVANLVLKIVKIWTEEFGDKGDIDGLTLEDIIRTAGRSSTLVEEARSIYEFYQNQRIEPSTLIQEAGQAYRALDPNRLDRALSVAEVLDKWKHDNMIAPTDLFSVEPQDVIETYEKTMALNNLEKFVRYGWLLAAKIRLSDLLTTNIKLQQSL